MEPSIDSSHAVRKSSPPRRSWRRLLGLIFLFGAALYAVNQFPYEVSYWYLASAELAAEQGRLEEAEQLVDRAATWIPNDMLPHQVRVRMLAKSQRPEDALEAIEKSLERNPPNAVKAQLYVKKCELLLSLERYDEAVEAYDAAANYLEQMRPAFGRGVLLYFANRREEAKREIRAAAAKQEPSSWRDAFNSPRDDNEIAYFSALVDENLNDALRRSNRAIANRRGEDAALLDTRGFVRYKLGDFAAALPDLERAVQLMQDDLAAAKSPAEKKALEKVLAVLLYHRSLVLDSLGKSSQAEADRKQVRQFGLEPDDRLF